MSNDTKWIKSDDEEHSISRYNINKDNKAKKEKTSSSEMDDHLDSTPALSSPKVGKKK